MEKLKILIVDDDKVSSDFMLKVYSGHICDIAINGIEAVDAFILALEEGAPYDLISLDLMLPLLDGESVVAAIRKIERDKKIDKSKKIKVIITSALNDNELNTSLKKYWVDNYFQKPIDANQVREYIRSL